MAENQIEVEALPAAVWAVLSDPHAYGFWVVGTKRIRGADDGFPNEGTRLYHTIGVGPFALSDSTLVLKSTPNAFLSLEASMGALGAARIDLDLQEERGGTLLRMREHPVRGPSRMLGPVGQLLLKGRNEWSLDRLKELAESRA